MWKIKASQESTTTTAGFVLYESEYGMVKITLPKKDLEDSITYKDGSVYATVAGEGYYTIIFKSGDYEGYRMIYGPGEYKVMYPKDYKPNGTVTATLYYGKYGSEMNEICSLQYEAE